MTYSKFPLLKKLKSDGITLEDYKADFSVEDLFKPHRPISGLKSLLQSYHQSPENIRLKELIKKIEFARKGGNPILCSLVGDLIGGALTPLIIELMQRGWISAISVDEDFLIRDFELSLAGKFIPYRNSFLHGRKEKSLAEETGLFLNIALKEGHKKGKGAGESVGDYLSSTKFEYSGYSVLSHGYRLNIPVTLHAVPGTGKLHYHQNFDGGTYGELLHRDFILYSSIVSSLAGNGVILLPGVNRNSMDLLLNAMEFSRESGIEPECFTIGITGSINDYSVQRDMDLLARNEKITVLRISGNQDLLLPLIASVLLEEV